MFISRLARHCLLSFIIIIFAAALPAVARAQYGAPPPPRPAWAGPRPSPVELSAFTGWSVNSDPNTNYGRVSIGDAQSFGAALAIASGFGASLELKWLYSQPTAQIVGQGINFTNSNKFDVDTHYFLIGGTRGIRRGAIEPFFGGSLGAVLYLPNSFSLSGVNYNPGDTWRMAFDLGGGLKIFIHPKLALRLGAELLGTVYIYGASFYTGTNGSAMGVTGGIPTVSGNFTLGLTFAP